MFAAGGRGVLDDQIHALTEMALCLIEGLDWDLDLSVKYSIIFFFLFCFFLSMFFFMLIR